MKKSLLHTSLLLMIISTALLTGCGFLAKRQISHAEAQKMIYDSLEAVYPQFIPTETDLKIETAAGGDKDLANGTLIGHLSTPTFVLDKFVNLPDGRRINLVRPLKKDTDTIDIPVTAVFSPTSDDWTLAGQPSFGLDPTSLGNPLSQFAGAVDESTDAGLKLLDLSQKYDADNKEQADLSSKVSDLTNLLNSLSSDVSWRGENPNFKTITYYSGGTPSLVGFDNWKIWLNLRKLYPEQWTSLNLGHVFDSFPDSNGSKGTEWHQLTYEQWGQIVPPILAETVSRDLKTLKARLNTVQQEIARLQDELRKYD